MGRRLLLFALVAVFALALLATWAVGMIHKAERRALHTLTGPARFELDARVAVSDGVVAIHGTGLFDGRSGLLRGRYVVAAAGSRQQGVGALDLRRLVLYLSQPSLTRELTGRRRWVRVDLGRALRRDGVDLESLLAVVEGDGRLRVQTTLPLAGTRVTLDMVLTPLAAPVHVALPPPSAVEDAGAIAHARSAQAGVRAAAAALEAYRRESGSYLGATARVLRRYDWKVDPAVRVVLSTDTLYCVELTVGATTAHIGGPGGRVRPGPC